MDKCDFCENKAINYTFQHAAVYCRRNDCVEKAKHMEERLMEETDKAMAIFYREEERMMNWRGFDDEIDYKPEESTTWKNMDGSSITMKAAWSDEND